MANKIARWGILGTSFISEVMAQAIQESAISELVAIGSRSIDTAKKFADQFSVPKIYDNYDALLNDNEIDVIYLGLPNRYHKEWMIRCAQAGKHILCEKPFVINAAEARVVISCIEKTNVFCMEALMYRCHPLTKKLQELIQNKIVGDIKLYNAIYTANIAEIANPIAGGSILNLGCYPVSLIRLLANAEPVDMNALGRRNKNNETDSQASIILKFEDDSLAVVSTADDVDMFWQFDIYGTQGHLKVITNPWLPDLHNKILVYRNNEATPIEMTVTADQSLYTYQIDVVSTNVLRGNFKNHDGITLSDSLGNIIVLEEWLKQISE